MWSRSTFRPDLESEPNSKKWPDIWLTRTGTSLHVPQFAHKFMSMPYATQQRLNYS